jgi:hypothetical protein
MVMTNGLSAYLLLYIKCLDQFSKPIKEFKVNLTQKKLNIVYYNIPWNFNETFFKFNQNKT